MKQRLWVMRNTETAWFAASELARCLRTILAEPLDVQIRHAPQPAAAEPGIQLGLFSDLPELRTQGVAISPDDDAIFIRVQNGTGVVAGSNERSILIGVYRLLHALGCRWPRPGIDGEFLPRLALKDVSASLREEASYRHRTVCIEGAVSVENVLDVVDWAPKAGFSGFFMQFPDGYAFFSRWYAHTGVPGKEPEPFSREMARAFTVRIEQEIRRRGLAYHAVGHGWTCKAIGVDVSHWDPVAVNLDSHTRGMLAEVKGVRALQWDRPMITSLCFSQPEVRRRMVAEITQYACQHSEMDLLHVWLDDGGGNKCECAACRPLTPTDWYVKLLHELDAALTAACCPTRIVFIGYSDLLWPPVAGTPPLPTGRFTFVYANSRASYASPWQSFDGVAPEIPSYVRNRNQLKRNQAEFLGFLRGWQSFFAGDSMLFEYYLVHGQQALDQYALSHVIHADVRNLKALGLNGLVSCQLLRCSFPTGLPMYVMGQTLWQSGREMEALRDEYFLGAFGSDSALCKEFVKVSSEEIAKIVEFESRLAIQPDAPRHLLKLHALLEEFGKVVERNLHAPDTCHAKSWLYMRWYLRLLAQIAGLFEVMAKGNPSEVLREWEAVKAFLAANEDRYQAVFDVWAFLAQFDNYLVNGRFSSAPEAVVQREG